MRALALIALAACSSAREAPDDAAPRDAAPDAAVAAAPDAVVAAEPAPVFPTIHAAHAQPIEQLAVSDDGRAAVTADALGNVRLWPSLDGEREPTVLRIARPRALAVIPIGDDLVVGAIDGAGTLEVARASAAGEQRSRTQVELGTGAVALVGTPHGLLVERADRVLALVDASGEVVRTLVPPPGRDLQAIVYRSGAALAVLGDDHGAMRGQWISLPDLTWGDATAPLGLDRGQLALSPDHARLAGMRGTELSSVELATGHRTELFGTTAESAEVAPDIVGFTAPDTVVARFDGHLVWSRQGRSESGAELQGPVAATDGLAISTHGMLLALATVKATHYLGYRIDSGYHTLITGEHVMVGGRSAIATTDLAGHQQHAYQVSHPEGTSEIYPLDLHHALVTRVLDAGAYDLVLLSLPDRDGGKVFGQCPTQIDYEPSTGLLACRDAANQLVFYHYDRKAAAFEGPVTLAPSTPSWVRLVDPARAHGVVALRIEMYPASYVWPIRAIHFDGRAAPIEESDKIITDDAGVASGTPEALAKAGVSVRVERRHGDLVARLENSRLSLRRGRGKQATILWEAARPTVTDLTWSASGELTVVGSGIARVDLETGALIEPQCGWAFGLWPERIDGFSDPLLCEE